MKWFCVYTKPQRETYVASYCRDTLGLECYLPQLRQHRTIRRKRQLVTSPLFPRYLFCRFDLGAAYRAVR
ncbi:transcription termination/antitermination NusG family protein, partial [Salmonella enterica]|uniref:transcription termination/antitermination NusG family protein n=1 Tax=Salmonella enterica TaxID=28901 RepID=UPI003D768A31